MAPPADRFGGISGRHGRHWSGFPPDTTGAISFRFVQSVNSAWAIVGPRRHAPLITHDPLSSLFSAFAPGHVRNNNDGDPIVLYDQLADRFPDRSFCYSVDSTPNHQVIAISRRATHRCITTAMTSDAEPEVQ